MMRLGPPLRPRGWARSRSRRAALLALAAPGHHASYCSGDWQASGLLVTGAVKPSGGGPLACVWACSWACSPSSLPRPRCCRSSRGMPRCRRCAPPGWRARLLRSMKTVRSLDLVGRYHAELLVLAPSGAGRGRALVRGPGDGRRPAQEGRRIVSAAPWRLDIATGSRKNTSTSAKRMKERRCPRTVRHASSGVHAMVSHTVSQATGAGILYRSALPPIS